MASKRLTPVQLAHELGVRPQIIYGYIKHGRVKTYANPDGKADLVDVDEVTRLLKNTRHRDPNAPKTADGRTLQRSPVKRGAILSWDKQPSGKTGRRIVSVSRIPRNEEDQETIVYLHDGTRELVWETATLAERIRKGYTKIENVPALLGMILFQLREDGQTKEADLLQGFLEENDIYYRHFVVEHEPEEVKD